MTFGKQVDQAGTKAILNVFVASNTTETRPKFEIDTARMYCYGTTEEFIGNVLREDPALREKLIVASKVNPFPTYGESLTPESVRAQAAASLAALDATSVDILYLHAPDVLTPIEVTLEAVNELHTRGAFKELGLSNYPSWEVAHIWHVCKERGWVQPTVYQGMYNAITRNVEPELFPCLRKFGMRFYAYNPLAGGLLTGKHSSLEADAKDTRFDVSNTMYRDRYWKPSFFAALDVIKAACTSSTIPMPEASLRWMFHHSLLRGDVGDGIIIGASSVGQLEQNLSAFTRGDLPADIVKAFDDAWTVFKPDCVKYFRP